MAPKSGNQRNYDAELAKARWESMNNHPAGYWNELAKQNWQSGKTLADTRFTSTADGSDPYYPAQSSMLDTLVTGTAHAIPASLGWRTPYEEGQSKSDPSKREMLTGPDLAKAGFGPRMTRTTADVVNMAGDVVAVWADTSLANRELGWRAERSLDDTLRSAWAWEKHVRGME